MKVVLKLETESGKVIKVWMGLEDDAADIGPRSATKIGVEILDEVRKFQN